LVEGTVLGKGDALVTDVLEKGDWSIVQGEVVALVREALECVIRID
jgi:hypothetical protein